MVGTCLTCSHHFQQQFSYIVAVVNKIMVGTCLTCSHHFQQYFSYIVEVVNKIMVGTCLTCSHHFQQQFSYIVEVVNKIMVGTCLTCSHHFCTIRAAPNCLFSVRSVSFSKHELLFQIHFFGPVMYIRHRDQLEGTKMLELVNVLQKICGFLQII